MQRRGATTRDSEPAVTIFKEGILPPMARPPRPVLNLPVWQSCIRKPMSAWGGVVCNDPGEQRGLQRQPTQRRGGPTPTKTSVPAKTNLQAGGGPF